MNLGATRDRITDTLSEPEARQPLTTTAEHDELNESPDRADRPTQAAGRSRARTIRLVAATHDERLSAFRPDVAIPAVGVNRHWPPPS